MMPWTKLNKHIKETETRFVGTFNHFTKEIKKQVDECKKTCMDQINIWKKSEQIKYNRIEKRLSVLEEALSEKVAELHQRNLDQELAAVKEIEGDKTSSGSSSV